MRYRAAIPVFLSGLLFALGWMDLPIANSQTISTSSSSTAPSSPPSSAAPQTHPRIQQAVDKLAQTIHEYGGTVGVYIVDIPTGKVLGAHEPKTALNPASNMKLVTAGAALWKLTAHHTYRTGLYGQHKGQEVHQLVLRGYGDPSFEAKDLWELTQGLSRLGVKRVRGDILVDQSFFDDAYVPPGFEQQPNEWAYFRAPVSAIALEANTVTMHVTATKSGEPALVSFAPPGFVDMAGRVTTGAGGSEQSVTLTLTPQDGRLQARVGGSIPEDSIRMRFTQRIDDPSLFAGYALRAILAERGIQVDGQVRAGGEKITRLLAMHHSSRLANLLERLGKDSDNFYAEMIFKSLTGDTKRRGLTTASGAEVARAYLESIGAFDEGTLMRNGSGLFDSNRLTAHTLGTVLRSSYQDPVVQSEFVRHLAVGGQDGTLRWRFRDKMTKGIVRAKTGTLASVTSLSGYVLPRNRNPIAFAIIVNGVAGKITGARDSIDRCVQTVVRESYKD